MATPAGAAAADYQEKYQELLKSQGPGGVVQPILAAFRGPTAAEEIEQLGNVLAASSGTAAATCSTPWPREKSA